MEYILPPSQTTHSYLYYIHLLSPGGATYSAYGTYRAHTTKAPMKITNMQYMYTITKIQTGCHLAILSSINTKA